MAKLMIIQPVITSYRLDFFNELATHFNDVIVFSDCISNQGFSENIDGLFKFVRTKTYGNRANIYYQTKIISYIIKEKPKLVFMTADLRALNFWAVLFICKILNILVYSHGQGLYNKPNPSSVRKFLYKSIAFLSTRYICYSSISRDSLAHIGISHSKMKVIDNVILNKHPISPIVKEPHLKRLLFIGRLRDGCNMQLLFDAMISLRANGMNIGLDIIGSGINLNRYMCNAKKHRLDVVFHGKIFDEKKISEISKGCLIGIYPGDAGLSVVHYMSLSLIPIVHDSINSHMGPEPSYIINGTNGYTFTRNSCDSLVKVIDKALNSDNSDVILSSFNSYQELIKKSMGKKFINIASKDLALRDQF